MKTREKAKVKSFNLKTKAFLSRYISQGFRLDIARGRIKELLPHTSSIDVKWWCNDVGFCDDLPNDMSSKLLWWLQVVDVFGGNLDFLKIKKLKNVCSDVWTCRKMWKQWMLFLTKTILLNGLLLLILPILAAPAQGEMCLWNNKGGGFHGNHYGSKWWIDCLPNFCCNLRHLLGW